MKKVIALLFIVFILSSFFLDAGGTAASVVRGIETCLYIIIPALFGFMAVSSYLIQSGLYRLLFKPLFLIFRLIIRLSEEEFGIFLLSLFGGYPVGAKLISDKPQYKNLLPYCYCPSPGFVISLAGLGIFANPRAGLAVYLSNFFTCVFIAVILNFKNPVKKSERNLRFNITQDVFTSSVISSARALFPVCVLIISFGVIIQTLKFYGIERILSLFGENAPAFFFSAVEITNAGGLPADLSLLPIYAALFSFGGLCITLQVPALLKNKALLKKFFLWRIPAALLSAGICRLLMLFFNLEQAVAASASPHGEIIPLEAGNPIASVTLFIMAVILIKSFREKQY